MVGGAPKETFRRRGEDSEWPRMDSHKLGRNRVVAPCGGTSGEVTVHCPSCQTEYREGFVTCADCGGVLVSTAPLAPAAAQPDTAPLVVIDRFHDLAAAQIALEMLASAGIDAILKDEQTLGVDWLLGPAIGGARLLVREPDAAEARQLLAEADGGEGRYLAEPAPGIAEPAGASGDGTGGIGNRSSWAGSGAGDPIGDLPPELVPGDAQEEAAFAERSRRRKRNAGLVAMLLAVPLLAPLGLLLGLGRRQPAEPSPPPDA